MTTALAKRHARLLEIVSKADAPETIRCYRSHVRSWIAWCQEYGVDPKPPADPMIVGEYLVALADEGLKIKTVRQHGAALRRLHRGHPDPFDDRRLKDVMRGLAREYGTRPTQKKPLTPEILRRALPNLGLRDQTILVVGVVTGLRRSELVSVLWDDLEDVKGGYVLTIRKSKTDQAGAGAVVGIPKGKGKWCPVRLLDRWYEESPDDPRIFPISAQTVNRTVKDAAVLAGEDPDDYGAHSMRAGLATAASEAGIEMAVWMRATRHTSTDVAAGYVRTAEAVKNPAHAAVVSALTDDG